MRGGRSYYDNEMVFVLWYGGVVDSHAVVVDTRWCSVVVMAIVALM